jgi:hypothetical protein
MFHAATIPTQRLIRLLLELNQLIEGGKSSVCIAAPMVNGRGIL